MDSTTLLLGVLFGSVGLGFFTYGRRQRAVVPFLVGVGLFVIPYLIHDLIALLLAGAALCLLPWFLRF